ncbi:MAG: hypothetical protein NTU69_02740 [Proteobacteria bacterium]|nr:hypothetical protein [Pseudomonadota bacterium]
MIQLILLNMIDNETIIKEQIRKAIIEAGNDPLFLADIEEVLKDYEYADFDNTVTTILDTSEFVRKRYEI